MPYNKNTKKYTINYWTKTDSYDSIKGVNIIDFRQWGLMECLYINYIVSGRSVYLYIMRKLIYWYCTGRFHMAFFIFYNL